MSLGEAGLPGPFAGENLSNLNVAKADMSFGGETCDRLSKPTTPSQSAFV
jgi:hypothetical protein